MFFFIHEPSNLGIYALVSVGLGEVYERTFIPTGCLNRTKCPP